MKCGSINSLKAHYIVMSVAIITVDGVAYSFTVISTFCNSSTSLV